MANFGLKFSKAQWSLTKRDPKVLSAYISRIFSEIWEESLRRLVKTMARVLTQRGLTQGGSQRGGVYSGMSAGSLLPLARALKIENEIRSRINSKKTIPMKGHTGTVEKGVALGSGAKAFSITGRASDSGVQVEFEFDINVPQWDENEEHLEALDAGVTAFREYAERAVEGSVGRLKKAIAQWVRKGTVPRF